MERLTGKSERGTYIIGCNIIGISRRQRKALDRLSEYEDTGLSPEQIFLREYDIKLVQRENKEYREEILRLREELSSFRQASETALKGSVPE